MNSIPIHKAGELRLTVEACVIYKDYLLLQKRSSSSDQFPSTWTLPGGHVDLGETLVSAAQRELKEESGVDLKTTELSIAVNAINRHVDTDKIFVASVFRAYVKEKYNLTETPEGEVEWVRFDRVEQLDIFPPIKHYIPFLINEKSKILYMTALIENMLVKEVIEEVTIDTAL